jgi:hypothetical protein
MRRDVTTKCTLLLGVPVLIASLVALPRIAHAQAQAGAPRTALAPDLQAAKTALAKYSDPLVAVRDGYFSTVACVDYPQGGADGPLVHKPGAMGVHFLNPANIGPALDPTKPQVLIYEPVGNKLVLTAAEWLMPVEAAGGKAPMIFGPALGGPMDGHEPIMPASLRHYDLHVWLWKQNPNGVFASTNPAVKCAPGAPYTHVHKPTHH